jgi:hypothetical protein
MQQALAHGAPANPAANLTLDASGPKFLEQAVKKLPGFFAFNMRQLFEFAQLLVDRAIPCGGQAH